MTTLEDDQDLTLRRANTYLLAPASKSLRVVCYGSSSSKTPEKYLEEARALGYILARRGHICVNGAGSFGCMAAVNAGAASGNGHIVGVIHEMFVVDGSDWCVRDGGAHKVFQNPSERDGPIRELLVAGGDDLQERKKLLVKDAEALVVLPGGPGTWDEVRPSLTCVIHTIGLSTPHLADTCISCVAVGNGVRSQHWLDGPSYSVRKCGWLLRKLSSNSTTLI